jgi:hypothetical protein
MCGAGQGCHLRTIFSNFVVQAFGLQDIQMGNIVTLVGRRPYMAHPRASVVGDAARHILNEVKI